MKCNFAVNEQLQFLVQIITSVRGIANGEWRFNYWLRLSVVACLANTVLSLTGGAHFEELTLSH